MTKKIRVLRTSVTNPWFNLATENWIFRDLDPDTFTLYLWQNDNTVVIGSCQNPWVECKVEKMQADDVLLARRQSGGGAVFHDLGNTNFTFLSSAKNYHQDDNFAIIIKALKSLGITAEKSGRNDILVDGRKVSGSAFRHSTKRSFHHGTLLVDANMSKLADYLSPNKLKLQAKGIKSVKSRVANLREFAPEIDNEALCQAIIEAFCQYHGQQAEVEWLDEATLSQIDSLHRYYQEFADWDWRFGKTPQFSHHLETRFDWGIIDWHLDVVKAKVHRSKIFSDALDVGLIELLESSLIDLAYDGVAIKQRLLELAEKQPNYRLQLAQVSDWLATEIS